MVERSSGIKVYHLAAWDAWHGRLTTKPTEATLQYYLDKYRPIVNAYSSLLFCLLNTPKKVSDISDRKVNRYLDRVLNQKKEEQTNINVWETGIFLPQSQMWVVAHKCTK